MPVTLNSQNSGSSGGTGGGGTTDISTLAKAAQLPASLGAKPAAQSLPVTLSPDGVVASALTNQLISGALTALNATVAVQVGAQATVGVQVAGNGAGFTLQPQASMDDGATWINVSVIQAGAGAVSTPVSTITAIGNYEFNAGGYTKFQLKTTTAAATGVVTGSLAATPAQKFMRSTGIGDQADAAATTTATGSFSLIALIKGLLARFLPFTPSASSGAGSIAAANTDYTAVPANATRRFLSVLNTHATASITINPVGAAYTGSALVGMTILPGDSYEWPASAVPNTALHIASATAGATYFIVEG